MYSRDKQGGARVVLTLNVRQQQRPVQNVIVVIFCSLHLLFEMKAGSQAQWRREGRAPKIVPICARRRGWGRNQDTSKHPYRAHTVAHCIAKLCSSVCWYSHLVWPICLTWSSLNCLATNGKTRWQCLRRDYDSDRSSRCLFATLTADTKIEMEEIWIEKMLCSL